MVGFFLCYHEAAKCLGKIYFMLKVKLRGFFIFEGPDDLSLQEIKRLHLLHFLSLEFYYFLCIYQATSLI